MFCASLFAQSPDGATKRPSQQTHQRKQQWCAAATVTPPTQSIKLRAKIYRPSTPVSNHFSTIKAASWPTCCCCCCCCCCLGRLARSGATRARGRHAAPADKWAPRGPCAGERPSGAIRVPTRVGPAQLCLFGCATPERAACDLLHALAVPPTWQAPAWRRRGRREQASKREREREMSSDGGAKHMHLYTSAPAAAADFLSDKICGLSRRARAARAASEEPKLAARVVQPAAGPARAADGANLSRAEELRKNLRARAPRFTCAAQAEFAARRPRVGGMCLRVWPMRVGGGGRLPERVLVCARARPRRATTSQARQSGSRPTGSRPSAGAGQRVCAEWPRAPEREARTHSHGALGPRPVAQTAASADGQLGERARAHKPRARPSWPADRAARTLPRARPADWLRNPS